MASEPEEFILPFNQNGSNQSRWTIIVSKHRIAFPGDRILGRFDYKVPYHDYQDH